MKHGRPLRFLTLILGGWTAARMMALWPVEEAGTTPRSRLAAAPATPRGEPIPIIAAVKSASRVAARTGAIDTADLSNSPRAAAPMSALLVPADAAAPDAEIAMAARNDQITASPPPLVAPSLAAPARLPSRWASSAWLIARPNGGDSLAFGQLGASQAGMRLTYALDRRQRLAASARVSAPLRGRGREAALGLDWQPTTLPVHLLVEERLPLDGGNPRPAVQLIAGIDRQLPLRLRIEAYGQAGAVHRRGLFADGAARVTRPLLDDRIATVEVGAGGWGAAQRGVSRLDVGPTAGLTLPTRGGTIRLGVDYRLRVAGGARPGPGPAVTLGSSF